MGPAVPRTTLTTTLGYLALLPSRNQAVRSLGTIAVMGEVSCLLAAVLVLPAVLRWIADRRAGSPSSRPSLPPPPSPSRPSPSSGLQQPRARVQL